MDKPYAQKKSNINITLFILAIQTTTEQRQKSNNAEKMTRRSSRAEQNVTQMVLIMCTFFLVGNVPNSISPILFTLNVNSLIYNNYVIFGNFMLLVSRGSYFFIYYHFNASFRSVFNKIARKVLRIKTEPSTLTNNGTISPSLAN